MTDDPRELDPASLPRNFVIKPAHSWGGVIVWDGADPEGRLPPPGTKPAHTVVTPEGVDWARLRALSGEWLAMRFGRVPGAEEWAYWNVPPRLLVEELLLDEHGGLPRDYKVFVFHGRAHVVSVEYDRFGEHRRRAYTTDWEALPVRWKYGHAPVEPRPPRLERMLEIAEALGAETDFVRVDLYSLPDRVVVGELTNYPERSYTIFDPPGVRRGARPPVAPAAALPLAPRRRAASARRPRKLPDRAGRLARSCRSDPARSTIREPVLDQVGKEAHGPGPGRERHDCRDQEAGGRSRAGA